MASPPNKFFALGPVEMGEDARRGSQALSRERRTEHSRNQGRDGGAERHPRAQGSKGNSSRERRGIAPKGAGSKGGRAVRTICLK